MRALLATLLALLNLAASASAAEGKTKDRHALEILGEAQAAVTALDTVSYRFEWLGVGNSRGRITGSARMRRGSDPGGGLLRAEGRIHFPPPGFEEFPRRFIVSTDGRASYLSDLEDRTIRHATAEAGDGHLRRVHPYLFLYHFVNPDPFVPMGEAAESVAYLGTGEIRGEPCDIVFVDQPSIPGLAKSFWYFSRKDRLPRAWISHGQVNGNLASFDFRMWDVETGVDFGPADVALRPSSGFTGSSSDEVVLEVGRPAPDFTLSTPDGRRVRLSDLRGNVVVLDFWVSWCPACAYWMPGVQKMHEDFREKPVRILGVNIMETADPVAHLEKMGITYPTLLHGEKVADLYKVFWQPAIFVVGPDGTLLYKDNGKDMKRNESVRAVVEESLRALGGSARGKAARPGPARGGAR